MIDITENPRKTKITSEYQPNSFPLFFFADSTWLTPNGRAPVGEKRLLISDIREGDTGLYVCVSEENNVLSVYNLQISRHKGTKRKTRSLPRIDAQVSQDVSDRIIQERNQAGTQLNLALAVCLSVFITFLVAFIVGVIARPWLDDLCQRITNKNSPHATNEISIVEQRQYDNQAFYCCDEPGQVCNHRERRVTISSINVGENSNVHQYDNVADNQENINKYETYKNNRDAHNAGDSGSETSSQSSQEENQRNYRNDGGLSKNTKVEYIQETKKTRRHSSSSDFSVSGDKIKPSQVSEELIQQRAPEWKDNVPNTSMDYSENHKLSSEPFDNWPRHAKDPRVTHPELWQKNEVDFELTDSDQSMSSSGRVSGSLKNPKQTGKKKRNDELSSNSSSHSSENEITKYPMNPEPEEDMEWNNNTPEVMKDVLKKSVSLQKPIHGEAPGLQGDSSESVTTIKQKPSGRNEKYSSDTVTGEKQKVVPLPRKKLPGSFVIPGHGTSPDAKKPAIYSSSSSSESELKAPSLKRKQKRNKLNTGAKVQASGNISDTSSDSESSSTRGSKVGTSQVQRHEQLVTSAPRPSVKAPHTVSSHHHWPAIDLQHRTRVKRRLDIKIKSPGSKSSSSSEREDGRNHIRKQDQWQMSTPRPPPVKVPQTVHSDQQWPTINLEHTTRVKRRLDIKIQSLDSGSSSSSDSEEETGRITKQDIEQTSTTRFPPVKVSQNANPDSHWPAINLERRTKVKRRLDIKVALSKSETSSSSDSEGERGHGGKPKPAQVDATQHPLLDSSSSSSDSEGGKQHTTKEDQWQQRLPNNTSPMGNSDQRWPAINLQKTTKVKRRLDIKAPSHDSDSSSSSDSEDDKGGHAKPGLGVSVVPPKTKDFIKSSKASLIQPSNKPKAGDIKLEKYTINEDTTDKTTGNINDPPEISSELESRWAKMNLNISRLRKRIEITARKQETPNPPLSPPPTSPYYIRIPHLSHGAPHTESPLNTKAPGPSSPSSSSSESENETTENTAKQNREESDILGDADITYKRSIFNSSSLVGSSTLPMVYRKHREETNEIEGPSHSPIETSLTPKTFPSKSFEETIKPRIAQSRTTTGVEVPPEIKWNGTGRRPTPISSRRPADGGELTQRAEPTKMEVSLLDDSIIPSEMDYIQRERQDEVLIPTQWRHIASSDPVSSRYLDALKNSPSVPNKVPRVESENHRERKGLNAIKAMSSERKKWDTHNDSVMDASPQFNGYDSPLSTRFNMGVSEEPKAQMQLPPHSNERVQNLLYGIPPYRRRAAGATTPPPVPATPPPDEIVIPPWRSPQSSERLRGIRMHPYQSTNSREPGPSTTENVEEHFNNPYNNISRV